MYGEESIAQAETVLFPLLAVLGLLANTVVILVIVVSEKTRSNRTVANTFVLNLAVADVLFLLALPFYTPSLYVNGYPYSAGMCKLLEAMKHISYHASILFLTGMSFDRYIAIVHSLRSLEYRTQRNARICCAVLWVASFLVSIPIIAFSSLDVWIANSTANSVGTCRQMFPGYEGQYASEDELLDGLDPGLYDGGDDYELYEYGNDSESSAGYYEGLDDMNATFLETIAANKEKKVCINRGHENSTAFRAWQWITFICFFVLPVLIIILCYFKIWRATAIRTVRSQRAEGNQEQQSLQSSAQPQKQNWKKLQSKVTIMVAILVSGFIICWMPLQIWIILTLAPGVKVSHAPQCGIINTVVSLLAWSNSVINPLLYSITSENFRKRAMTTLSYMRYGYRRTIRMSMTRTSRTGIQMRTEKTDMIILQTTPTAKRFDTMQQTSLPQLSPPQTPIDKVGVNPAF